ncbi:MAG: arginine--tRNA ligase [Spirochaetes bacterium]|nr:arginine--tRNA ligase [Spirochaetota bacterium]
MNNAEKTVKEVIIEDINKVIIDSLSKLNCIVDNIVTETPPDLSLGDAAYPMFKYSAALKMKPYDIALAIKKDVDACSLVEKSEVKGGYLNVYFNKTVVSKKILPLIIEKGVNFGKGRRLNQKALVEFSSPNTNKPLHLGHCRNNAIGDSISRILDFYGFDVIKLNLVNDRGIHICKSMLAYKLFGEGATPESAGKKSDHFVGDYYVKYATEVKNAPEMEKEASEMLRLWEDGDPSTIELWKKMNNWAVSGIKQTYDRMGISFTDIEYESNVYLFGKEVVAEGLTKGAFYKESDGSVWVNNEDIGLDKKALLRSDGTSIYITQDMGTAVARQKKYKFDKLIYVVGSEQIYHFKTLFAIFKKLDYQWASNCYHLSYGMVNLPEGKMKSREGNVVDADNLLDLLFQMALDAINDKEREIGAVEKSVIAEKISLSALKYYLLNFSTAKDVMFIPEKSISFDGNTGPYIQYTTARINSLLSKSALPIDNVDIPDNYTFNEDEWGIISYLLEFEKSVKIAAVEYSPIEICSYLYNLSKLYNKFYHDNQILSEGDVVKKIRLAISKSVLTILSSGLNLLGIAPVEKM